jgi:diguanylate cyclase (GGDEF)-like protein
MKLAWIGLINTETKQIDVIEFYGDSTEYLNGLEIKIGADQPLGRGPTAISLRNDEPFWCQDFQESEETRPWHERASRYDLKSSASLPLHRNGQVFGTFTLYSDKVGAFDEDVRNLLIEMAMDIDFALSSYDKEAERQRSHQMEEFRTFMLEQLTGGVSLAEILNGATLKLESIVTNSLCSILLLDQKEQCLRIGAAPHLPDFYNQAIDGVKIGVGVGSCGNTAYTGERTIVENIATHPFWQDYKGLAQQAGLASCWSEPILISGDQVIGTFAIYQRAPSAPDQHSLELLKMAAHFIAIAIERKNAEERIHYLAHFDALSGLPNRETLEDRAQYLMSLAKRNNDFLAIMFLDLDHFKDINDSLGHSVGDILLTQVATRLRSMLREEDTLSRLGGDEFIFLLPSTDATGAAQVAQKLIAEVAQPYEIEQYELIITASIGIAIYPNDGASFEMLSKSADIAMYCAKQESRNAFRFFTSEMEANSARNLQLVNALRYAQSRNQLELYYQPQIALESGQVVGAEALLRWKHPELGFVSPAEFIQLAEETGLILPIGEWVLREAAKQAKTWVDKGLSHLLMAVNLSAVQFRQADLPHLITSILEETGLPPEHLELELTEGVAMHNPLAAIEVMNNLYNLGIRMSIDDFGTGYSSLNYLKKFKVYKLKIDQSFVRDINSDPEDRALVAAIISMASSLGMRTIAEGVETVEQKQYLIEKGCDEVQGYLYSKPLPADEFEAWVRARQNL